MKQANWFLLLASVGIFPVALSYGLFQNAFFGIDISSIEMTNIFRAIMGLYIAMGLYWFVAAFNNKYTMGALQSLVVSMSGLAVARMVSMAVDGTPNMILIGYTLIEVVMAFAGYKMIRDLESTDESAEMAVGEYS